MTVSELPRSLLQSLQDNILTIRCREYEHPATGKVDVALFRSLLVNTEALFSSSQSMVDAFGSGAAFKARQLDTLYQTLLELYSCDVKKHQVLRALQKAALSLLSNLDQKDETALACLLALFQSPLLLIEAKSKAILPSLGAIFGRSRSIRRHLIDAWICYPMDIFARIINALQTHISSELLRERRLTPPIMSIIRVMSKLKFANQQRSDALPVEAFYNPVVSEKLDVMDHYLAWRQAQDPRYAESQEAPPFSFCEFPFLLSAQAKSRLLLAESQLTKDQAIAHSQAQVRLYGKEQAAPTSILPIKYRGEVASSSSSTPARSSLASKLLSFFTTKKHNTTSERSNMADAQVFTLPSPSQCSVAPIHAEACVIRVRRLNLVDDSLEELSRQSRNDLRKPLRLVFIGEEGVDAGGLKKEWFQLLMEQMLDPDFGLVTHNEETNALLLNAHSLEPEDHFFLLGLIVGLALYNNVLINFPLDPSIYKKLLGKDLTLSDFEQTYPRLGQSLRQLISFKEGSEGSIEETFCLTFTFDVLTPTGIEAIELIPGGASTPVTVHNREEFVNRVVSYHLNESIVRKFDSFGRGFKTIISGPVIKLLEAIELERMICGCPSDLHFETLRGHTKYDGGFHDQSKTVIWFWQVVQEMDSESGKKLLKFVSGSDRIPIGGLAKLRFIIQKNTVSDRRLPTAHTCFNTLLLPEYSSLVVLKERLMVAIENAQGFGLK